MGIQGQSTSPIMLDQNGRTIDEGYRNMQSGNVTVTTSSTPVQLTNTPTEVKSLDITADYNNTDFIVVGGSGVVGPTVGRKGVPLAAGNTYTFKVTDLSLVWVDAGANAQKATYNYFW